MGTGLAIVVALLARDPVPVAPPEQAPAPGFPAAYEAVRVLEGDERLPRRSGTDAAAAYADFIESAGYFGAFAVSRRDGFGWSDNYTTQAEADQVALAHCQKYGTGCRIVARLRPGTPSVFDGQPLSQTQARALDKYAGWPGAKAIAINRQGAWGGGWRHVTRAAAQADALKRCRSYTRNTKFSTPATQTCRIVWSE